jgi:hypothetical protein
LKRLSFVRRFAIAAVFFLVVATAHAADLRVTIVGNRNDSRVAVVREAVAFWNRELRALGVHQRFGPITFSDVPVPEGERELIALRHVPDDVVIALTHGEFASFTLPARGGEAALAATSS